MGSRDLFRVKFKKLWFSIWYYFRPPWDTGVSPPELMNFIKTHPPGRALDLGCGTGTNAVTLAQHGWAVTGIDFAAPAVLKGRRKAIQAGVEIDLKVGDVTRVEPIDKPYDLILDIGCFHSLSEIQKMAYIENLERLMAPTGIYLLYAMVKVDPKSDEPGIVSEDIENMKRYLMILDRADGTDRKVRPSAWFKFEKPEKV